MKWWVSIRAIHILSITKYWKGNRIHIWSPPRSSCIYEGMHYSLNALLEWWILAKLVEGIYWRKGDFETSRDISPLSSLLISVRQVDAVSEEIPNVGSLKRGHFDLCLQWLCSRISKWHTVIHLIQLNIQVCQHAEFPSLLFMLYDMQNNRNLKSN